MNLPEGHSEVGLQVGLDDVLRHDLEELVELDGAVVVGVRAQHHLALESGTKLSLGSFGQNLNLLGCFLVIWAKLGHFFD